MQKSCSAKLGRLVRRASTRWASFKIRAYWLGSRWVSIYSLGEFQVKDSLTLRSLGDRLLIGRVSCQGLIDFEVVGW